MPRPARAYRIATAIARSLIPLAARLSPRLARSAAGREASATRFRAWGDSGRDPSRPLVLVHAASAGELRQAEPVVRRLRSARPSWQLAITCFSPSGIPVAAELPADVHGLLPWDRPEEVRRLLSALQPSVVAVSKLDLWPELACQTHGQGVPLALIAATVRPSSGRLRWPARPVLASAYALIDRAAAVSQDDAERLTRLGVRPDRITVEGDPRYDSVLERVPAPGSAAPAEPRLVAGSTWGPDDEVLLGAFAEVRARQPEARLLIAPHEPTPDALARLSGRARRIGLPSPVPWGSPESAGAPLAVLETIGGLAPLYGIGQLAYVGGGFGRRGLHSVLEPAALGVPVIVGPRWRESRDAIALRSAGALVALEGREPRAALTRQWLAWLADPATRHLAGCAAREMVLSGAGAADRCAALVLRLVEAGQGRP